MDEILKKLFETNVLSSEIKTELEQAFKKQLDDAIASARTEAEADVRAQLTEQWVTERDALVEAIET
jgi:TPP-dependent pyruvate/acetoin dehydrogenase alpha subunit